FDVWQNSSGTWAPKQRGLHLIIRQFSWCIFRPDKQDTIGASAHRRCQSSQEQTNAADGPHEHFRIRVAVRYSCELWNQYNELHKANSFPPDSSVRSIDLFCSLGRCDLQASQARPAAAHRRSRVRRVSASVRPKAGCSPIAMKADIAPPSSAPSRAGTHPVAILTARVKPSMASTAIT